MTTDRSFDSNTMLRVSAEAVSTTIDDEAVILDPISGRYFGLDGVGARVWALLAEAATVSTIIATIVREYSIDETQATVDILAFVEDLNRRGLVRVADENTA